MKRGFRYAPDHPRRSSGYGEFAAVTGLKPGTTEYKTAWARANRERSHATKMRWAARNPEKIREKFARYRRENPEKRAATCKAWVERNQERHRKNRAVSGRRSYWRNPAKFILLAHERRVSHTGKVTPEQWRVIWDAHDGKCKYCGREATALDHVIPLARGGKHSPDNVVPACKSCNSSKHTKLLSEWKGPLCQR